MKQPPPPTVEANSAQEFAQPQLQLVVHAGPLAGKGFPITGNLLTFGRDDDNDIVLDDERVSRHHAKLLRYGQQVIMEDLGSTNGTLVNGQRISDQHVLQPADIISIGASIFGVKGFSAPNTIGMTQVSPERETFVPSAPPPPRPASNPRLHRAPSSGLSKASLFFISGLGALFLTILGVLVVVTIIWLQPTVANIPTVLITAPANNSQLSVNVPVTIQLLASDPNGIVLVELWSGNAKLDEATSPVPGGQATLTASFQWTPKAAGTYTLEAKAYNAQGNVNVPATVTVNAVTTAPTNAITATAVSGTAGTPTPTMPNIPLLVTLIDLNVRGGPGTNYDLLGLIPSGAKAEVLGRDDTRQWWQIRFPPAIDGFGWVSADPNFAKAMNVENMPIVRAPATPTGTSTPTPTLTPSPTYTPIPFTSTPTHTPSLPTYTPTPALTPTPTQPATTFEFDITPKEINGGQCVSAKWNVTGVKEVYFQDHGVGGNDKEDVCPRVTTTYSLRVVKTNGTEEIRKIEVIVHDPLASSGNIKIGLGQTVDFDKGTNPGDDFIWRTKGNARRFETLSGVKLAPKGKVDSLDEISHQDCRDAIYNRFDTLDDSSDTDNRLTDRRAACFITNEGRMGKLRFPKTSDDTIKVEWITWQ